LPEYSTFVISIAAIAKASLDDAKKQSFLIIAVGNPYYLDYLLTAVVYCQLFL